LSAPGPIRLAALWPRLAHLARQAARTARLMVGVPDYQAYVAHVRERHPGAEVMGPAEFFANRQEARYRAGGGRCC
jgi:uncharacterized short protein YbdD (DUF466 family)